MAFKVGDTRPGAAVGVQGNSSRSARVDHGNVTLLKAVSSFYTKLGQTSLTGTCTAVEVTKALEFAYKEFKQERKASSRELLGEEKWNFISNLCNLLRIPADTIVSTTSLFSRSSQRFSDPALDKTHFDVTPYLPSIADAYLSIPRPETAENSAQHVLSALDTAQDFCELVNSLKQECRDVTYPILLNPLIRDQQADSMIREIFQAIFTTLDSNVHIPFFLRQDVAFVDQLSLKFASVVFKKQLTGENEEINLSFEHFPNELERNYLQQQRHSENFKSYRIFLSDPENSICDVAAKLTDGLVDKSSEERHIFLTEIANVHGISGAGLAPDRNIELVVRDLAQHIVIAHRSVS